MSACPSLNLAEAVDVTALEVPCPMLELPERAVRVSGVEDVAF